jgi:TatD DNase family protein
MQTSSPKEMTEVKERQKDLFVGQVKLANQLNLPLILHVRDHDDGAYLETLNLLEEHWTFQNSLIFHCVSGPIEYIKRALALKNSYFGFDGNITFKNAQSIREIFALVQQTDSSKILLETDAPYLAPEPNRGRICEPMMISQTATYMERELGANLAQIYQNSLNAFNIN